MIEKNFASNLDVANLYQCQRSIQTHEYKSNECHHNMATQKLIYKSMDGSLVTNYSLHLSNIMGITACLIN